MVFAANDSVGDEDSLLIAATEGLAQAAARGAEGARSSFREGQFISGGTDYDLDGRTSTGQVTIQVLAINDPDFRAVRAAPDDRGSISAGPRHVADPRRSSFPECPNFLGADRVVSHSGSALIALLPARMSGRRAAIMLASAGRELQKDSRFQVR